MVMDRIAVMVWLSLHRYPFLNTKIFSFALPNKGRGSSYQCAVLTARAFATGALNEFIPPLPANIASQLL